MPQHWNPSRKTSRPFTRIRTAAAAAAVPIGSVVLLALLAWFLFFCHSPKEAYITAKPRAVKPLRCWACWGTGIVSRSQEVDCGPQRTLCARCQGFNRTTGHAVATGVIKDPYSLTGGVIDCPQCNGTGYETETRWKTIQLPDVACTWCNGTGSRNWRDLRQGSGQ